jgi:hypothetical protein
MSYSDSFPTQRPSLNLVFNGGSNQLDSRISYSRSSTGTAFSSERHKSSENLVTQSDASNWTVQSAVYTKTANQSGPDGSTNARKFTEKANGSDQYRVQSNSFTPIANKEITYSVWLKQTSGNRDYQQIRVGNIGANKAFSTFNLTNGTVDQTGGTLGVSASVNAGPTGWYQCIMKFTPTSTTALSFYIYAASASGGEIPNVTGDTGNSYTLFGAQVSTLGDTVVTETSGSMHRSFAPTLKSYSSDQPRFEYSAADGQSVGLLIEQQKSNLALNSNDFTNASWNKQRVTVTPSAAIGPDGQLSASLLAETTDTTTIHFLLPVSAIASGYSAGTNKVTHSIYAKYAGKNLRIVDGYSTVNGATIFDLQNGTVVSGGGVMQSCGNGWWRCSIQPTVDHVTGNVLPYIQLVDGTTWPNASDAGDGYSGVLLFGLQTEQQSVSSYITTGSSAVTKSADSCSLVSAPLLDNGSGGLTVEYDMRNASSTSYALQTARTTGATNNDGVTIFNEGLFVNGAGSSTRIGSTTSNVFHKVAASWESGSQKISRDGSAVTEDTTTVVPQSGTDKLHIGTRQDGNASVNGHIKAIAIYSEPLTSTNLTTLSQL